MASILQDLLMVWGVAILELLSIYGRLCKQFWVLDVHLVTAPNAAQVIHCAIHVLEHLQLAVCLLKLLLILLLAIIMGSCLKLGCEQLLFFDYLLLTFRDPVRI
jgi:hypothetical protein